MKWWVFILNVIVFFVVLAVLPGMMLVDWAVNLNKKGDLN